MRNTTCVVMLLLAVVSPVPASAGEGTLAAARELYVSASYDEALTMLGALNAGTRTLDDQQSIDLYRTLCFVALGRTADADKVIETMLMRQPLYHAPTEELSPRVVSAFQDVRRRILPAVIQKEYADAKASFDTQDYAAASAGFAEVIRSIGDPDIASLAGASPLADIRTLSASFRELSVKLMPPPPAPRVEAKPVRPVRSVYSADDGDVQPPTAIQQRVPRYPAAVTRPLTGVVEFVVDETGAVQAPMMLVGIDAVYDASVVSAAKKWQYQPATLDGKPVKYIKRLTISVTASPQS